MSETTSPGRSSRTTLLGVIAAVAVVVPAAFFGLRWWLLDDSAEPVPTDEVVAEFREATATTAPAGDPSPTPTVTAPVTAEASTTLASLPPATTSSTDPPLGLGVPSPGVYRYATSGFEEIDALGGARHEYPAETTITVTPEGCGVRLRWDVLRERREEWRLCVTEAGIEVQPDSVQYHEFFGRGEEEPVECDVGVLLAGRAPGADAITEQDCWRVDEAWLPVWEVLGTDTLTVDGEPVDVVHVRQRVVDEDDHWEYTTIDWYLAAGGLPVRVVNVKQSNSPTLVGDVVYTEEYELTLVSFTPVT